MARSNKHSVPFILLCALAAFLSACGSPQNGLSQTSPYLIEPIFQEFYDFLGGEPRLGLALSAGILEGVVQRQYLEKAVMVYNPELPPSEQYSLAPVGEQLGQWDEPLASNDMAGVLFVEGYIVYEGFVPVYEAMGGQRYVGRPLTGVRFVLDQNRVEQYFENLGFFINLDDQEAGVQLMEYGRIACAETCGASGNPAAIIQIELPYGEPFVSTVSYFGDAFVGARIAGPYQMADGTLEVIYENVVLYANADQSERATPRPILSMLGIAPDPLVIRLDNPNVMFYGVDGEFGYNVPLVFSDFIAQHGGFEIFGQPISEVKLQGDGTSSQCFANACLSYLGEGRVAPLPMGLEYKARFYDQPAAQVQSQGAEVRIQVWEEHSQISSSESQIIYASLHAGTQLLPGLQPYLEIMLPGGGNSLYQFPATDAGGQTQLSVPPVLGQNGTLVPYKVCLEGFGAGEVCTSESYMIWGNP
ncbi:MAG: hypothetical protein WEC37_03670 [Anaerolineales bacterium]